MTIEITVPCRKEIDMKGVELLAGIVVERYPKTSPEYIPLEFDIVASSDLSSAYHSFAHNTLLYDDHVVFTYESIRDYDVMMRIVQEIINENINFKDNTLTMLWDNEFNTIYLQ